MSIRAVEEPRRMRASMKAEACSPPQIHASAFGRRPDRSLGWAAMESAQAAALARSFIPPRRGARAGPAAGAPALPPSSQGAGEAGRARSRSVLAWVLALHLCYIAGTGLLIAVYAKADPPATVLMAYRKWSFGWKLEEPRPLPIRRSRLHPLHARLDRGRQILRAPRHRYGGLRSRAGRSISAWASPSTAAAP